MQGTPDPIAQIANPPDPVNMPGLLRASNVIDHFELAVYRLCLEQARARFVRQQNPGFHDGSEAMTSTPGILNAPFLVAGLQCWILLRRVRLRLI